MLKGHPTVSPPTEIIRTVAIAAAALTTPEAAAYLNVRPSTLEQWRWNGKGPSFSKLGRSVRYRRVDLDAFLDARVFSSTTEAQAAA